MRVARLVTVLSLIGSVVLSWTGMNSRAARMQYERALALEVPARARAIQLLSRRVSHRLRERNEIARVADPQTEIRRLDASAGLGDVELRVNHRTRSSE